MKKMSQLYLRCLIRTSLSYVSTSPNEGRSSFRLIERFDIREKALNIEVPFSYGSISHLSSIDSTFTPHINRCIPYLILSFVSDSLDSVQSLNSSSVYERNQFISLTLLRRKGNGYISLYSPLEETEIRGSGVKRSGVGGEDLLDSFRSRLDPFRI